MVYKKTQAFTLIEMIVVVAIISILLPSLFAIIFTLLRLQVQLTQLQRVKEVGDSVSNNIIATVRNYALAVDPDCLYDGTNYAYNSNYQNLSTTSRITFRDKYDNCFGYYVDTAGQLASASAVLDPAQNYHVYLVATNDNTQTPITVSKPEFTRVNKKLAKLKFTVSSSPKASYLRPQSLNYQFYVYLRRQ